jgi:hypothetical protein
VGGGIRAASRRNRLQWCQPLRFLEEPGPVVALASFPGSGNTWVRYLLQQATGERRGYIATSGKNKSSKQIFFEDTCSVLDYKIKERGFFFYLL